MLAYLLATALVSFTVGGRVTDAVTHAPLVGVTVQAAGLPGSVRTDSLGRYRITLDRPGRLRFARAGYATTEIAVAAGDTVLDVALDPSPRLLETVAVVTTRGDASAPITRSTLDGADIARRYAGQDVPLVLAAEPAATAYSESGSLWNYSYIRLRGIDQSRINMTLDGVPLNEPEDQQVYFSDFPDFANSVESVQIQRGVGTSTNGVASFGGAVNFESVALAGSERGAEAQLGGGSFGARRASLEYRTGQLPNGTAFYGRISGQQSDGYRRGSGNWANGFFVSGGYFGDRNVFKAVVSSGLERNGQAYTPVPDSVLRRDPRANPIAGVGDRFRESFALLSYTRLLSPAASIATTVYGFQAGGFYDYPSGEPGPALRFRLASRWGGVLSAWNYERGAAALSAGVHASTYSRDHSSDGRADLSYDYPGYLNTGYKSEGSAFGKARYTVGRATLFGDVQVREAAFRYRPDRSAGVAGEPSAHWTFVNPKAGITVRASRVLTLYGSYGTTGREPTRADLFGGADDVTAADADSLLPLGRVRPERVHDVELGATLDAGSLDLRANVYAMHFRDEIARTGATTPLGYDLRANVGRSVRRGVELDASYRAGPRLLLSANAALSDNRIRAYQDEASGIVYHDVEPILTPRILTSQSAVWRLARWASVTVDGRYTGRAFLAPTGDARLTTPASYVVDGGVELRLRGQTLLLQSRNVTNTRAYPAGDVKDGEPRYFVLAPRSYFVTARVAF